MKALYAKGVVAAAKRISSAPLLPPSPISYFQEVSDPTEVNYIIGEFV
jgi:hypothetical protein